VQGTPTKGDPFDNGVGVWYPPVQGTPTKRETRSTAALVPSTPPPPVDVKGGLTYGGGSRSTADLVPSTPRVCEGGPYELAFTRYCHSQYCMACIAIQDGRGGTLHCAIAWAMKGRVGCPTEGGVCKWSY